MKAICHDSDPDGDLGHGQPLNGGAAVASTLSVAAPVTYSTGDDTFPGATPTLTVTLRASGTATNANDTLAGTGLTHPSAGSTPLPRPTR